MARIMSKAHKEALEQLLDISPAISTPVAEKYLRANFPNRTKNITNGILIDAVKARVLYSVKTANGVEYLAKSPNVEITELIRARNKAIAVACEFMPLLQSPFPAPAPFTLTFFSTPDAEAGTPSKVVNVCNFIRGAEASMSTALMNRPANEERRVYERRIGIVDPDCNLDIISRCGFIYLCDVNDDASVTILKEISPDEAWADVVYP